MRYDDCQGSRNRQSRAIFIAQDGAIVPFAGNSVPGVAAVVAAGYSKAGKWSSSAWDVECVPGATLVAWRQTWEEGWDLPGSTWAEVFAWLSGQAPRANLGAFQEFARGQWPRDAARLDQAQTALEAVWEAADQAGGDVEEVAIRFGSPTNRQAAGGYWSSPKTGTTPSGVEVEVAPGTDDWGPDWNKPEAVRPAGARVIAVQHMAGYHGGTYTITVSVPVPQPWRLRNE